MKTYMIFRTYTAKERPDMRKVDRTRFFGWSKSKDVVMAFLSQRDPKKYKIIKMSDEEIAEYFSEDNMVYNETKLDILVLRSASTNEKVLLITTINETMQAEKDIQRMFYSACKIVDYSVNAVELFMNLQEKYSEALEIIGFMPPEVEAMLNPVDYESSGSRIDFIEEEIDDAYSGALDYPREEDTVQRLEKPLGLMMFNNNTYQKMLYSLESFIKVLKEDL